METNDLLEVFGGRDNLKLMCGATRFRKEARNCMSFHVGTYLVRLSNRTRKKEIMYYLDILDRVSGRVVGWIYTQEQDLVRSAF